jgi:hypothetical protein
MVQEVLLWHIGVSKRPPERMPIHLVVVGKDDPPPIGVLHFHMAALAVYFPKAHALERGVNPPA